jgi:mono/diheme cytochrome c family protein
MRAVLILLVGFIFSGLSFSLVHADENTAPSETVAVEDTGADREAYAKSLFEGRCQMCHQLPEPGMLTPKQWKLILTTMQQRMSHANVPPLTEDETERLLEYLTPRAR